MRSVKHQSVISFGYYKSTDLPSLCALITFEETDSREKKVIRFDCDWFWFFQGIRNSFSSVLVNFPFNWTKHKIKNSSSINKCLADFLDPHLTFVDRLVQLTRTAKSSQHPAMWYLQILWRQIPKTGLQSCAFQRDMAIRAYHFRFRA